MYFLERIENIQETVEQVKNTTEKNFQDVKEIKDDVTKIKGWYTLFSLFYVEILVLNFKKAFHGV